MSMILNLSGLPSLRQHTAVRTITPPPKRQWGDWNRKSWIVISKGHSFALHDFDIMDGATWGLTKSL
jgi:hypothetical protein